MPKSISNIEKISIQKQFSNVVKYNMENNALSKRKTLIMRFYFQGLKPCKGEYGLPELCDFNKPRISVNHTKYEGKSLSGL